MFARNVRPIKVWGRIDEIGWSCGLSEVFRLGIIVVSCILSFVVRVSDVIMVFDGVGLVVMVVEGDIFGVVRCVVFMVVVVVGSRVVEVVEGSIVATKERYRYNESIKNLRPELKKRKAISIKCVIPYLDISSSLCM